MEYYETRKQSQLKHLQGLLMLYSNKYRFITELLDNVLDLRKKKATVIETMLIERKYDHLEDKGGYNYLIKMPMDMVNEENVEKLKQDFDQTKEALEALKQKNIVDMYYEELCELEKAI